MWTVASSANTESGPERRGQGAGRRAYLVVERRVTQPSVMQDRSNVSLISRRGTSDVTRGVGILGIALMSCLLAACASMASSRGPTQSTSSRATTQSKGSAEGAGTDVIDAQLLDNDAGWALTDKQLNWTEDGEHWRDITPSRGPSHSFAGTFFLNQLDGWVVVADGSAPLSVLRTSDGGMTWTTGGQLKTESPDGHG